MSFAGSGRVGGRRPLSVGYAVRQQAPLAYPTALEIRRDDRVQLARSKPGAERRTARPRVSYGYLNPTVVLTSQEAACNAPRLGAERERLAVDLHPAQQRREVRSTAEPRRDGDPA